MGSIDSPDDSSTSLLYLFLEVKNHRTGRVVGNEGLNLEDVPRSHRDRERGGFRVSVSRRYTMTVQWVGETRSDLPTLSPKSKRWVTIHLVQGTLFVHPQ